MHVESASTAFDGWIGQSPYHGSNLLNRTTSLSNHRPTPIEQCDVANGQGMAGFVGLEAGVSDEDVL